MEYIYKCDKCERLYTEVRNEDEPQWFTKCECGGSFIEVIS